MFDIEQQAKTMVEYTRNQVVWWNDPKTSVFVPYATQNIPFIQELQRNNYYGNIFVHVEQGESLRELEEVWNNNFIVITKEQIGQDFKVDLIIGFIPYEYGFYWTKKMVDMLKPDSVAHLVVSSDVLYSTGNGAPELADKASRYGEIEKIDVHHYWVSVRTPWVQQQCNGYLNHSMWNLFLFIDNNQKLHNDWMWAIKHSQNDYEIIAMLEDWASDKFTESGFRIIITEEERQWIIGFIREIRRDRFTDPTKEALLRLENTTNDLESCIFALANWGVDAETVRSIRARITKNREFIAKHKEQTHE